MLRTVASRALALRHRVKIIFQKNLPPQIAQDVCPICLDPLTTAPTVKRLPCGHFYHVKCINHWTETKARHRCPTCRAAYQCTPVCSHHRPGGCAYRAQGDAAARRRPREDRLRVSVVNGLTWPPQLPRHVAAVINVVRRSGDVSFVPNLCFEFVGASVFVQQLRILFTRQTHSVMYAMLLTMSLHISVDSASGVRLVYLNDHVVQTLRQLLLTV